MRRWMGERHRVPSSGQVSRAALELLGPRQPGNLTERKGCGIVTQLAHRRDSRRDRLSLRDPARSRERHLARPPLRSPPDTQVPGTLPQGTTRGMTGRYPHQVPTSRAGVPTQHGSTEDEGYRETLQAHTANGEFATLIVTWQGRSGVVDARLLDAHHRGAHRRPGRGAGRVDQGSGRMMSPGSGRGRIELPTFRLKVGLAGSCRTLLSNTR